MVAGLKNIRQWLLWLAPHGLHVARAKKLTRAAAPPELVSREVLFQNAILKNRHERQRCFILGNGPSAKAIDLASLSGQVVISVSNGYLHKEYNLVAPQYHCVPQITYGRMTEADVVIWFKEMHERLGSAELFLNETEAALVQKHDLFRGRKVYYVAFRENFDEISPLALIDLSVPIPRVESAPVMALMVAMYMRFSDIALLGVDHDHFKSGEYVYAFNLGVQANKDAAVGVDGQVVISRHDDFQSLARLWRQYRALRYIAAANDVEITNATQGGELDEFFRVNFDTVVRKK